MNPFARALIIPDIPQKFSIHYLFYRCTWNVKRETIEVVLLLFKLGQNAQSVIRSQGWRSRPMLESLRNDDSYGNSTPKNKNIIG